MEILNTTKPNNQVATVDLNTGKPLAGAPEAKDAHKMVLFHNFSNETFGYPKDEHCRWNGQAYSFPAGHQQFMELYMAYHFAKHLIDRELNKKLIPNDRVDERMKMFPLAIIDFGGDISQQDMAAALFMKNLELSKNGPVKIEIAPEAMPPASTLVNPKNSYEKLIVDQQRMIEDLAAKVEKLSQAQPAASASTPAAPAAPLQPEPTAPGPVGPAIAPATLPVDPTKVDQEAGFEGK